MMSDTCLDSSSVRMSGVTLSSHGASDDPSKRTNTRIGRRERGRAMFSAAFTVCVCSPGGRNGPVDAAAAAEEEEGKEEEEEEEDEEAEEE